MCANRRIQISALGVSGVAVLIGLAAVDYAHGQNWIENFDDGVGRFSITTGEGETVFVHDPDDGNINGTFIRRESGLDRRLADLARTFDRGHRVAFAVEWRPISENSGFAWPSLGFFDLGSKTHVAGFKVRTGENRHNWNVLIPGVGDPGIPDLAWNFGETYLLEFEIDGPKRLVHTSISIRVNDDFVLQRSSDWPFPNVEYEFDSLGMGNIADPDDFGSSFVADIDNFAFSGPAAPADIYVNGATGNDAWDGRCEVWDGQTCGPKKTIQAGIDAAVDGHDVIVADGTYNEVINFNGKAITLRSSDGPDVTIIDGTDLNDSVVKCINNEGSDTVLQGFTITGGKANLGGGMRIDSGSSVSVIDCTFTENFAGGAGAGLFSSGPGQPEISNCRFVDNVASPRASGGGISTSASDLRVIGCLFKGNVAADFGGGIHLQGQAAPLILNCLFVDNVAGSGGGAAALDANPVFVNSTFVGNEAIGERFGGADGGGYYDRQENVRLHINNCIFWNNTDQGPDDESAQVFSRNANPDINYSCVQFLTGNWDGVGNIGDDPKFVEFDNGNLRLLPGSPCIDAADNEAVPDGIEFDLDGIPRFVDDRRTEDTGNGKPPIVDMGAYEFQPCEPCDTNCDGEVDLLDIDPFIKLLVGSEPCGECAGDANGDGSVDLTDVEPFIECLLG